MAGTVGWLCSSSAAPTVNGELASNKAKSMYFSVSSVDDGVTLNVICPYLINTKKYPSRSFFKIYSIGKFTKVSHIFFNGVITLTEANKTICWVHFEGRVFCNGQSTGGERSENPSAALFTKVIQNPNTIQTET